MDEVKIDLMDEVLRLRKDRSDIQMLVDDVKERIEALDGKHDRTVDDLRRIQIWTLRVKEVLELSTLIEIQEEQDKTSISLIGLKEQPAPKGNDPLATEKSVYQSDLKKKEPVLQIDKRCVNCHNNPSSSDRQLIL